MKNITFIFSSFFLLSCFFLPAEVLSAQCGAYEGVEEFDDVKNTNPYYEDICFVKQKKWAEGFKEKNASGNEVLTNEFKPSTHLTRAEFAKIIAIIYSSDQKDIVFKEYVNKECFLATDLSEKTIRAFYDMILGDVASLQDGTKDQEIKNLKNDWRMQKMCYAKKNGLVDGFFLQECYEDKTGKYPCFEARPDSDVSFIQAVKMTVNAVKGKNEDGSEKELCWKDKKSWGDKYLYSILSHNIINDFTMSTNEEDSSRIGDIDAPISRDYAAYLISNIEKNKKQLTTCDKIIEKKMVTVGEDVFIRSGPIVKIDDSLTANVNEGNIIATIVQSGTEVTGIGNAVTGAMAIGSNNQWQLVNDNKTIGFIYSSRLKEATQPPPPSETGKLIFPFKLKDETNIDQAWQICQGYNTSPPPEGVTHYDKLIYSFDFAVGINNIGANACSGTENGTENQEVISPAAGEIIEAASAGEYTHLKLTSPISNGHNSDIKCIVLGHMKYQKGDGKISKGSVSQKNPLGKVAAYADSGGYAHIHMAAYSDENCTSGNIIPFGTAFAGYDFSGQCDTADKNIAKQYHGCTINPPATYQVENKCGAIADSKVCGE